MNRDEFEYIPDAELPVLVLAIDAERWGDSNPKFRPGRRWEKIAHQCAGMLCNQRYFYATRLNPTKRVRLLMDEVDTLLFDSFLAQGLNNLTEVLRYRSKLREYGLDCHVSYTDLQEAVYPIDLNKDSIRTVTRDKLPEELDTLVVWETKFDRIMGILGRWHLYILGQNSD